MSFGHFSNSIMALPIEGINHFLEGILTFKKKKHSIPFAVPGQQVQFQLTHRGRRRNKLKVLHLEGEAVQENLDFQLATPFCEHYRSCGGCRAQHIAYEDQFRIKSNFILEEFAKHFSLKAECIPSPLLQNYRNRMDFCLQQQNEDNGKIINALGLRPPNDYEKIIAIQNCPIQSTLANQALHLCQYLLHLYDGEQIAYKTEELTESSGALKYMSIRTGIDSSFVLVLSAVKEQANDAKYVQFKQDLCHLFEQFFISNILPAAIGNTENANTENANTKNANTENANTKNLLNSAPHQETSFMIIETYLAATEEMPAQENYIFDAQNNEFTPVSKILLKHNEDVAHPHFRGYKEKLGGVDFSVPFSSFFQPSPRIFDLLLQWCFTHLSFDTDNLQLLDLYCGMGVLSAIFIAKYPNLFEQILGYDSNPAAIREAQSSFSHLLSTTAHLKASFSELDLHEGLPPLENPHAPTIAIIDPPRAGMHKKILSFLLENSSIKTLIYISCNPASQLEDLKALHSAYTPKFSCIVDCYPHTRHLETAVILHRN